MQGGSLPLATPARGPAPWIPIFSLTLQHPGGKQSWIRRCLLQISCVAHSAKCVLQMFLFWIIWITCWQGILLTLLPSARMSAPAYPYVPVFGIPLFTVCMILSWALGSDVNASHGQSLFMSAGPSLLLSCIIFLTLWTRRAGLGAYANGGGGKNLTGWFSSIWYDVSKTRRASKPAHVRSIYKLICLHRKVSGCT